jgi:hypothetical protein
LITRKGLTKFSGPQSLRVYLANGVLAARCETRTIAAEYKAANAITICCPWVLRAQSAVDRTPIAATIPAFARKEKGRALRVL